MKNDAESDCAVLGDCYEAALNTLLRLCREGDEAHYRLVHAEIIGQGPIDGLRHGHAFVVDVVRDLAYDESNGKNVCWPLPMFAAIARMHEVGNWHMYTLKEASRWALETGVYGPWELKTSTGL
jgi:hypothetical protein